MSTEVPRSPTGEGRSDHVARAGPVAPDRAAEAEVEPHRSPGLGGAAARPAEPGEPGGPGAAGVRDVQRLAYRCAEAVAAELEPGVTERAAAGRMRRWLVDHGVDDWFHLPFAWFGDRTAFRGIRVPLQFFPSGRRLEEGMPFILDCAPVVAGCTADIGYTGCLGENPTLDRVQDALAEHRALILDQVRERRPLREIYRAVDARAAGQGLENRHRRYPFHVIAHQVWSLPAGPRRSGRPGPVAFRFGLRSLRALARTAAVAARDGWSPLWSGGRFSDHPPVPGLWAVEPHLAVGDVGAKFEEILVVTEDDAYWLDDDLPHVRRWTERGVVTGAARSPASADQGAAR